MAMQQVAVASGPVWTVARSLFGDAQAVLVDVNAGTDEELRRRLLHIPRLPPTVAERIVQLRPFENLAELLAALGPKLVETQSDSHDRAGVHA